MTSVQISCPDRNIFTRGIGSTPGGFRGTGHSCCVCAAYCMLFRAHYGTISLARMPEPAHQRVATFRLLDVAALAHEFRFPIDLWRKSWTSSGPLASSGGVCYCTRGAQRSHPLTSLPSLYPSFPPTSPGEAETGPTIWELEVKLWAPVAPPRLGPGTPVTAFSPSNYPCQPQTLVLSPIYVDDTGTK